MCDFQPTELQRQKMLSAFAVPVSNYFVIDNFPLAICEFGKARYCRFFQDYGADYRKCPSKKKTYFGYKFHAMITLEGYITTFEVTPASTDDQEGLRGIVDGQCDLVILGDKVYVGENLIREKSNQGICLIALKRLNSKVDSKISVSINFQTTK